MESEEQEANAPGEINKWVELYCDQLYSWALYKTSSKETAEDLVQETFLAAVQAFNSFEGRSHPGTWLFGILNNKLKEHYKNALRKHMAVDNAIIDVLFDSNGQWKKEEHPLRWNEGDENLLDNADFKSVLKRCLEKLPPQWNAAVNLKFMEEKNSRLICQELNISPTNYWQIIHRSKLSLRKCLELNWFNKS